MTINIRGKEYVTIAERVAAAHEDNADFEILNHEIITIGETGRWWFVSTIRVHERLYTGTAEIKFDAPKGSPDASNPVECAETSAIGRALGFAGYGVVDGIASADEVARSEPRHDTPVERRQVVQQQAQRKPPTPIRKERADEAPLTGPFNPLSDVPFRNRCNAIGYRTVAQVEELIGDYRDRTHCFDALEAEERKAGVIA